MNHHRTLDDAVRDDFSVGANRCVDGVAKAEARSGRFMIICPAIAYLTISLWTLRRLRQDGLGLDSYNLLLLFLLVKLFGVARQFS